MTMDREMKRRRLLQKRVQEKVNQEGHGHNPGLNISFSSLDERRSASKQRVKQFHWNRANKQFSHPPEGQFESDNSRSQMQRAFTNIKADITDDEDGPFSTVHKPRSRVIFRSIVDQN